MDLGNSAASSEAGMQIVYLSFLLRLRIVSHGAAESRQFYLKNIHTQEEFHFADQTELMRFLTNLQHAPD